MFNCSINCPCVHLFHCPYAQVFNSPCVHFFNCPYAHVFNCPCVHVFNCPFVQLSICSCVHVFNCPCVQLSMCSCVQLSICSCVQLFMCPFRLFILGGCLLKNRYCCQSLNFNRCSFYFYFLDKGYIREIKKEDTVAFLQF